MVHHRRSRIAFARTSAVALLLLLAFAGARSVAAQGTVSLQPFFGTYEGRTLMPMGEVHNRDLRVVIRPFGASGFTIEWLTTIHPSEGPPESKVQVIDFAPTARPNVYATPRGVSSPGPVDGEPYAWAKLAGETLTVNELTIEDGGDYVVQTYDRTLTAAGMSLDFMRMRNGRIERQIKGTMKRVGG